MSKHILLTGSTGFIGNHILNKLISLGCLIKLVIREGSEKKIQTHKSIVSIITSKDIFLESEEFWVKACFEIDIVIHSAWYTVPGKYQQSSLNMDCLIGTLNLAKGAKKAGVKKIVGIGTCAEYDDSDLPLSNTSPLNPKTPYASAKAATYFALEKWCELSSINFAWCRLFYIYGEGEHPSRLYPYLISKMRENKPAEMSSGNQVRDFLPVKEVAKEIIKIALNSQNGPINICSGIPITIKEFAIKIADQFDKRNLLIFGARKDNIFDPPFIVGKKEII